MIKRSHAIGLALMGSAPFFLAGCLEEQPAPQFSSVDDCAQDGRFSREACQAEYDKAKAAHPTEAPRFANLSACEAEFGAGQCQTLPSQGQAGHQESSVFVPAMMGFMAARLLDDLGDRDRRGYDRRDPGRVGGGAYRGGGRGVTSEPLYKYREDRVSGRTGSSGWGGQDRARSSGSSSKMSTASLNRGGFGSSAAARSSWGG